MRLRLHVLVFVAGACSLATEMAGARLLAPFFGTSNVVWANVIGLILVYLSLGYWLGGRFADRYPNERTLGFVVLFAAVTIAILPFATRPLFGAAANAFDEVSAGAFVASFVGTLLMFALPVTALGAVAPWAIRLAVTDIAEAGAVAGRLYALSTLGSIAGTFLPVLYLIPEIGTRRTMLLAALGLALAALPMLPRRRRARARRLLALLLLVPPGQVKAASDGKVLFEGESPYQFVQVVRAVGRRHRAAPERGLGDPLDHAGQGRADRRLLGRHACCCRCYRRARRAPGRSSATPAARSRTSYGAVWPRTRIDGVEIDPLVTEVGRRYFGMTQPAPDGAHRRRALLAARRERAASTRSFVDAYRQPYIPFHLATREFFSSCATASGRTGCVAINVGTPPEADRGRRPHRAHTMRAEFPAVQQARYDDSTPS